ncbi:MAG TPA: DUF3618 domain-containing protein [Steroidobacter sp.]|uniref:DUF3618 domain-containing protein n=1 Tax=Steroidobacter sp. TaxID=1978227 RepID=UPI002ED91547
MNASTDKGGTWKRGGTYGGASDLEREGDQLRADMDRTLDEIERELSPHKLLDRSMEFFREHGSDFVREAGDTIRRNPMPVLLTAAGVIWLTAAVASSRSSSGQGRQRWDGGSHLDEDMASFDDFSAGHGYSDTSTHSGSTSRWREKSQHLQHQLHEKSQQVSSEVGSHLARLVREQPIALGALAVAAGALLGAALPMTRYENRVMGPSRNRSSWRDREERGQRSDESREFSSSAAGTTAGDTTMIDE